MCTTTRLFHTTLPTILRIFCFFMPKYTYGFIRDSTKSWDYAVHNDKLWKISYCKIQFTNSQYNCDTRRINDDDEHLTRYHIRNIDRCRFTRQSFSKKKMCLSRHRNYTEERRFQNNTFGGKKTLSVLHTIELKKKNRCISFLRVVI